MAKSRSRSAAKASGPATGRAEASGPRRRKGRFRRWLQRTLEEWGARRRGRAHTPWDNARAARDVVGPLGAGFSSQWQQLERNSDAYLKSFDRHLPPSLHISERDRLRHGDPIPLAERAIKDWRDDNRTTDPN